MSGGQLLALSKPAVAGSWQGPGTAWWHNPRTLSRGELVADGVVHAIGLAIAAVLGTQLLVFVASHPAPHDAITVAVYVVSLLTAFSISMVFNLAPVAPIKRLLARFDQAAIFLLIAGTYTPILALLGGWGGGLMMGWVWTAALTGACLKLLIPQHFGRSALVLYVALGWSGLLVVQPLAAALPPTTLAFLFAGGVVYSAGIVFHLWEKLPFHNVVWHCFVVAGASLHLWAIYDFTLR